MLLIVLVNDSKRKNNSYCLRLSLKNGEIRFSLSLLRLFYFQMLVECSKQVKFKFPDFLLKRSILNSVLSIYYLFTTL